MQRTKLACPSAPRALSVHDAASLPSSYSLFKDLTRLEKVSRLTNATSPYEEALRCEGRPLWRMAAWPSRAFSKDFSKANCGQRLPPRSRPLITRPRRGSFPLPSFSLSCPLLLTRQSRRNVFSSLAVCYSARRALQRSSRTRFLRSPLIATLTGESSRDYISPSPPSRLTVAASLYDDRRRRGAHLALASATRLGAAER